MHVHTTVHVRTAHVRTVHVACAHRACACAHGACTPWPSTTPALLCRRVFPWVTLTLALTLTRRVFPWVTGYGKRSDLWAKLGYERRVVDTRTHPEKWVAWRRLKLAGVPPLQPSPAEGKWAHNFFNAQLRSPLLWLPLCSPANQSSRASVVPPAGSVEGIPLALTLILPLPLTLTLTLTLALTLALALALTLTLSRQRGGHTARSRERATTTAG